MGRRNAAAQRQNTSQRPRLTPVAESPAPAKGLLTTVAPGRRLQLYSVAVVVALALLRFLGPSISRGHAQQSAGPTSGSSSSVAGRYDLRSQVPYDSAPASEQGARVIVRSQVPDADPQAASDVEPSPPLPSSAMRPPSDPPRSSAATDSAKPPTAQTAERPAPNADTEHLEAADPETQALQPHAAKTVASAQSDPVAHAEAPAPDPAPADANPSIATAPADAPPHARPTPPTPAAPVSKARPMKPSHQTPPTRPVSTVAPAAKPASRPQPLSPSPRRASGKQTVAQRGPSPARATVPQAREGTSVKTPTGSTSADSAMTGIATLVGRIAAPPAPNGQMSAQVVLVDLESNQTVNGLVSAENRFAFQNLGPGVKYYLAAWQHLTAPANEAASTLPSEIRLSWHQLVQVDASGTFSIDLSRENCDAMYSNDVLPTWALQAPENGRRAVLTRVRGAVAPI